MHLCYSFYVRSPIFNSEFTDADRWNLLQRKAQAARTLKAFRIFRDHGIEPILIKGLAASRFYPESQVRLSLDIDLAVSSHDFETGLRLARASEADGLAIDLHRELRNHDSVGWADLVKHSQSYQIDGGSVRVLRPEDHLRVLCVHWLTDGCISKDRLWDIYYAIENREKDFDWDRLLNVVSEKRRRWLVCTIGLAQRYLDLDLSGTPIENEAASLPAWLTQTIEAEWAADTPDQPLETTLGDRALLIKQIKKRLYPNPISATVLMNGSFDAPTRVFYQIGNIVMRMGPSYRRISRALSIKVNER
jgi:hypothetical protein